MSHTPAPHVWRDQCGRRYEVYILMEKYTLTLEQQAREIIESLQGLARVDALRLLRLPKGLRWSIVPLRDGTDR